MPVPVEVFLSNRDLWLPVVCLLTVLFWLSIPLSGKVAPLFHANRLMTFLWLFCVAVIPAFTLPTRFSSHGRGSCTIGGLPEVASIADPQNFLNVLLYVPPAFLGIRVTRHLPGVVAGLAVTSVSMEIAQLFADQRNCNSTDLVFNVLGALAGAGLAALVPHRVPPGKRPEEWVTRAGQSARRRGSS